jgi:hypothetical protein
MCTWWSVNLVSVSGSHLPLGHMNPPGMMALGALTYMITALAHWIYLGQLPSRAWSGIERIRDRLRRDPAAIPVALNDHQVCVVARDEGIATLEPAEGPDGLVREVEGRRPSRVSAR